MRFVRSLLGLVLALPLLAGGFRPDVAAAQGVTTAAVSGRVTDPDGRPLPSVQVTVTNVSTGFTRSALSNAEGYFTISGLQIGGPYRVEATGIGYAPFSQQDIQLALGQNLNLPIRMQVQAVQLGALTVLTDRTSQQVINPNRTGQEQLVTEHQLSNLPTITRNFTDFIQLSPVVGAGGGATSIGQQNNRFNNIQIDGAIAQDIFGLGSTGQPGGQAGARSITIDAVKEYQVLAAPYDVRQSNFSGGLINAVTKSGTNDWHGSLSMYYKNLDLVNETIVSRGDTLIWGEFTNRLIGGTLGGPIARDRAHFFAAVEFEHDERPASGIAIGRESETVTGIAVADADRFKSLLQGKGLEPGDYSGRTIGNPNKNIFGRVDIFLNPVHRLTLRHNWVTADDDVVQNRTAGFSNYSFDSNWYFFESTTNSSVAQLNSSFSNGWFNEMTAGWTRIRDRRSPPVRYPVIIASVTDQTNPTRTKRLVAGAEYFSQGNELDQDAWQITNNLTIPVANHQVTFGIHNELFKFRNLFLAGKTGEWTFSSLDDFENDNPSSYRRSVPAVADLDPNARFSVNQLGVYAQTEWSPRTNLTVTGGLRYDVPFVLDKPFYNQLVEDSLGRRTDELPSGNGTLSPRLGFNWDVTGDQQTQVRGGAGLFTGRHPYVWLSNAFGNTGISTVTISCTRAAGTIPAFTTDPDAQPTQCLAGTFPSPPRAVINLVDPDFKYPSNWRLNAAIDRRLFWGVVGTAEVLYTRAHKQIFLRELNLNLTPVNTTQGGRPMFGTIGALLAPNASNTTIASPRRVTRATDAVVELTNSNQDRAWSITGQLQKRYTNGADFNISYTYSDAKDISGLTSSIATSNIGFNPVTGNPNAPPLATSDYETPHKLVVSGAYDVTSWFRWSALYIGASGDGYSYVYDGDVNADGYEAAYASNRFNDLLYVPTGPTDITLVNPAAWTTLSQFIESEECLRENKGRILARNACREPWQNRLDTRFTFMVPTIRGQRAEVALDILNVLNLLNGEWGHSLGIPNPTADLLELRGWDPVNNRGIFQPTSFVNLDDEGNANPFTTFSSTSRWQMQLGVRYVF